MDEREPETNGRGARRFGLMKLSSVFVLVLASGSAMLFVRSVLQLESYQAGWSDWSRSFWITTVTESAIVGVLAVLGPALLIEAARGQRSPRAWGTGRMTIAVTSLFVALNWLDAVARLDDSSLRGTGFVRNWLADHCTNLYRWGAGLLQDYPVALAAMWLVWWISRRSTSGVLDLKEGIGLLVGLVMFVSFASRVAMLWCW